MFVVIFEVYPKDGQADTYFDMASDLKPLLEKQPVFISVERFQSLVDSKKFLSISAREDKNSLLGWRRNIEHIEAKKTRISAIFQKYRIRLSCIERDYNLIASD